MRPTQTLVGIISFYHKQLVFPLPTLKKIIIYKKKDTSKVQKMVGYVPIRIQDDHLLSHSQFTSYGGNDKATSRSLLNQHPYYNQCSPSFLLSVQSMWNKWQTIPSPIILGGIYYDDGAGWASKLAWAQGVGYEQFRAQSLGQDSGTPSTFTLNTPTQVYFIFLWNEMESFKYV